MDKLLLSINNGFLKKDKKSIYKSLLSFVENNRIDIKFQKHPLGFKYFKLGNTSKTEEFRLHFWIDTSEKQDVDLQIHDHSFDFESFVVSGSLVNNIYQTKYNQNEEGLLYDVKFSNHKSELVINSNNQTLVFESSKLIESGDFYSLKSDVIHCTENKIESTVSLLKIIKPKNKIARVYSPKVINEILSFERIFVPYNENSILIEKLIEKIKLEIKYCS